MKMAMRDPPRPWLWPRHTTHDGTRSDRRGGWTRRETGGRRSRGRGRMRTRGFRKCASSIRLEKSCCVSTAARLLSMTRPGLLCVPQSKNFGRTDPDPKAGLVAHQPFDARNERARVRATGNGNFTYEVTFVRLLAPDRVTQNSLFLLRPPTAANVFLLRFLRVFSRSFLTKHDRGAQHRRL